MEHSVNLAKKGFNILSPTCKNHGLLSKILVRVMIESVKVSGKVFDKS